MENIPYSDPQLMQQILAGQRANVQLGPMQQQIAMAQQVRNTPTPDGQSVGSVYSAASPLQHIGALMQNIGGGQQVNKLQGQADALRQNVAQGAEAQMQQTQNQKQLAYQMQQQKLANDATRLDQAANRQDTIDNRLTAAKEYVNPDTGERRQIARRGDGRLIDLNTMEETDTEGFREMRNKRGIPKEVNKEGDAFRKGVLDVNRLQGYYRGMTEKDIQKMSSGAKQIAGKALSPDATYQYFLTLTGLSDEAKNFITRLNSMSTKIRNKFFGAALSKHEAAFAEGFLPSALGIGLEDTMLRLDDMQEDMLGGVQAIDPREEYGIMDSMPEYDWFRDSPSRPDYTQPLKLQVNRALPAAVGGVAQAATPAATPAAASVEVVVPNQTDQGLTLEVFQAMTPEEQEQLSDAELDALLGG